MSNHVPISCDQAGCNEYLVTSHPLINRLQLPWENIKVSSYTTQHKPTINHCLHCLKTPLRKQALISPSGLFQSIFNSFSIPQQQVLFSSWHQGWGWPYVGSGDQAVEHRTVNRGDGGSIPPTAVLNLRQFRSPNICLYLSEETLKAGGPFDLVSMPGKVKDPTQGVNVYPVVDSLIRERENSCVSQTLGYLEETTWDPLAFLIS